MRSRLSGENSVARGENFGVWRLIREMDGKVATPSGSRSPDALVARTAARQHGVISIGQLRGLGVSDDAVRARLLTGRLHRVHRGVYAVGHSSLPFEGRCCAAVLAAGGDRRVSEAESVLDFWSAAVSHRSAACLWDLMPAGDGPIDVIVGGLGGKARRRGVRIHRSRSLVSADVTLRGGIPLTTPARTIADLRRTTSERRPGALAPREVRRAIRQANVLGLPIDEESARDRTRGDLERDFLRICRRCRLPLPEVNVRIDRYLVDFLWRERRLVVETDSYLHHRGRAAFQDDRDRDLDLRRQGYEVVRLSEKQVIDEPDRVAETLAAVLRVQPRWVAQG
jgi:very-short-patch-repair endonuclease